MARPNKSRSVGGERNLAERIKRERRARNWSPAHLAEAMTAAGCSIATSAVYKIEDDEKPRKISVDELLALANVFDVTVENLLTPVEVLDTQRGQDILQRLDKADGLFTEAISEQTNAYADLFDLAAFEHEVFEYVMNQRFHRTAEPSDEPPALFSAVDDEGKKIQVDDTPVIDAILNLEHAIIEMTSSIADPMIEKAVRSGWRPDDGQH